MTLASKAGLSVIHQCADARKTTNKVLEMIDEGLLDPTYAVMMCLKWMSDDSVAEMCKANDIDLDEIEIDYLYHDASEEELRKMGCFGEEDEEDFEN